MVFRPSMGLKIANSSARDPTSLNTTQDGDITQHVAIKRDLSDSETTYQDQSATKVILLLVSVFMSMFLVALDRTIISTVRRQAIQLWTALGSYVLIHSN